MKVVIIFLFSFSLFSNTYKVISIIDGDTIKIELNKKIETVRLYGIDCPEIKQEFGPKAKEYLIKKILNKKVDILFFKYDFYGRAIALVYFNDHCINELLIVNGLAWVYEKYCKKPYLIRWINIQKHAREKKINIWSTNSIPPWEWRKSK